MISKKKPVIYVIKNFNSYQQKNLQNRRCNLQPPIYDFVINSARQRNFKNGIYIYISVPQWKYLLLFIEVQYDGFGC